MPPRRRTTASMPGLARRPRVAGLAPAAAARAGGTAAPGTPIAQPPATEPERAPAATDAAATDAAAPPDTVATPDTVALPETDVERAPDVVAAPAAEAADVTDQAADPQVEVHEPDPQPDTTAALRTVPEPAAPPPGGWRGRVAALRARPVRTLAVVLAVFAALTVGLAVTDHLVRSTPAAANTALADIGTTTDVVGQLNSALETVYSYDFTQLDENERLARGVITPEFAVKFDQLFAQVRQLAPQQQAVVSAVVTTSAVQSIEGDRAVLVAFLDQQATRANPGAEPQQVSAAGRLTVIAQRDGDAWKIADVINR